MAISDDARPVAAPEAAPAQSMASRAFAAHQREAASLGREEAAASREAGARIRAEAAIIRDGGARIRDDAARVRDQAARVRDQATLARDEASRTREEGTRLRLLKGSLDRAGWAEVLEADRRATEHGREAARRDREAAELDRVAAEKDREAAEQDRMAASPDRDAADRDRDAAERDRLAADNDRAAADADRDQSEGELSRAEAHLSRAERLAAMGSLAAGLAHEINNPLTSLRATLATLERETTPAGLPLVADAQLAAGRIAQVVADMRTWLLGASDHAARQRIELRRVIDESLRLTAPTLGKKARVVVELEPSPPLWGVPSRLGQVLTNLLLNAAQAMVGPVEANEVRITSRPSADGRTLELRVSDTGTGIPPEAAPHLFDPFFTTREGSGGTGLGLAMCERIVGEHGGSISVESPPGPGATFLVRLPLEAPEPAAAPPRPRVLLIDDDAAVRRSLGRLLATSSEVVEATNGREGLDLLLAPGPPFELVLCDLMMPVMNGLELYRALREVAPPLAAQLVFITGGATTPETAAFLGTLPNLLLQKPLDLQQLRRLVERRARGPVS